MRFAVTVRKVLDAVQQQRESHAAQPRADAGQQRHHGDHRKRTVLTANGLRSD
jgi:hypothetical protein